MSAELNRPSSNPVTPLNRREWLKAGLLALAAVPLSLAFGRTSWAKAAKKTQLSESAPNAQALKYRVDWKKAKKEKSLSAFFADGKTKNCASCNFYNMTGKDAAAPKGNGTCALFPTNYVSENAWCQSWVAKMK